MQFSLFHCEALASAFRSKRGTAASAITLESGGQKRGEDWLGNVIWLEHHRSSSQARFVEANKK